VGALKGQVSLCKALHQVLALSQGQIVAELDGPVAGAVREEAIESGGARDAGGQPFRGLPKELEEIAPAKCFAEEHGRLRQRHAAPWLVALPSTVLALALALA